MTDEELEERIAREQWWMTPEGRARIAQEEAEFEALMKEGDELESQIEAYLKEKPND